MGNDITERFIINMYVRGMKISEIANTVNITQQEVTEIIKKSKREIFKKTEKIENEDSRRLNVQVRKVNSTSKIIKEGKEEVKEKKIVSKTSKKLLEIKKKIMSGEEYDKEDSFHIGTLSRHAYSKRTEPAQPSHCTPEVWWFRKLPHRQCRLIVVLQHRR